MRILRYTLKNGATSDLADLAFAVEIMGQAPLGWPQPNGYPDTQTAWMSASFVQTAWANHMRLTGGWWTETLSFPGIAAVVGNPSPAMRAGDFIDQVCGRLLFQPVNASHKAVLLRYLGRSADEPVGADNVALLDMFTKVVLDSPYFAVR